MALHGANPGQPENLRNARPWLLRFSGLRDRVFHHVYLRQDTRSQAWFALPTLLRSDVSIRKPSTQCQTGSAFNERSIWTKDRVVISKSQRFNRAPDGCHS